MSIFTLTLNCAIDVHFYTDDFAKGGVCYASRVTRQTGGKGLNIARALRENGVDCTAVVAVGHDGGDAFVRLLNTQCEIIHAPGTVRENVTVHCKEGETRLCADNFEADKSLLDAAAKSILPRLREGDILTFTGRLPCGILPSDACAFIEEASARGAKVVIDCVSIPFEDVCRLKPWLIKPNVDEIALFSNEYEEAARSLAAKGVENVMITLGADGAIYANGRDFFTASVPSVENAYQTGAGDATIAGFIAAKGDAREIFVTALAYGCASCMREGMLPPLPHDVEKMKGLIVCR